MHLSESEISDAEIVRSHVHNLAKLGEMKWRYRVVDEGQSPRDEAIKAGVYRHTGGCDVYAHAPRTRARGA